MRLNVQHGPDSRSQRPLEHRWPGQNLNVLSVQAATELSLFTKNVGRRASTPTTWAIIAHTEAAQGVFEVDRNKWATRRIKSPDGSEKGVQDVDLMISTGDDGSVKVENMEP